jgi:hypothetical protein
MIAAPKFFSIDEFGPVAIKMRGGRTFTPEDQTIPSIVGDW